ncbi:retropepsin-like aspartic protease [uncultured Desulfobacter sp.]|uniref:retropepsin-like aspartic protease family protein n=1 Tax=uncultured Desulfobacter sp. TaxID=240139 RepID=UPI002AA6DC8C|nr:retropepsin-like aspartic protease [uncultured Desulfobacter sp.]
MKNIKILLSILLLIIAPQFFMGCSAVKAVSMMKGSKALQEPNISFKKDVPVSMKGHMLIVDVYINDIAKPFKFVVDTGAITVLTERTAQSSRFTDQTKIKFKGLAGNVKDAKMISLPKLGIKGLEVSNLAAVVMNLDKFDSQIDGILGSNYFQYFNITIDYRKPSLLISNTAPAALPEDTATIPFEKDMKFGFAPIAECKVDGVSFPCMIDTGSPDTFSIPSSKCSMLPGFKKNQFIQSNGSLLHGALGRSNDNQFVTTHPYL